LTLLDIRTRDLYRDNAKYWPTPRARKTSGENEETWQKRKDRGDVSTPPLGLAVKMWPTPLNGSTDKSHNQISGRFRAAMAKAIEERTMYPTPTATERSGINPNTGKGAGLSKTVQSYPTPKAGGNRNSRQAIIDEKGGGKKKSGLALEQAIECSEGILPKEVHSVAELPPKYRSLWPTPTVANSKNARNTTAHRNKLPPTGLHGGDTLVDAVDPQPNWPTPTGSEARQGVQIRREGKKGTQVSLTTAVKVWPTPRAHDWKGPDLARDENRSGKRHSGDDLATATAKATYPTPTSSMMSVGDMEQARFAGNDPRRPSYAEANEKWPTPRSQDSKHGSATEYELGRDPGKDLLHVSVARRNWATPKASPSGPDFARASREGSGGDDLVTQVARTDEAPEKSAKPGQLSPSWVGFLMGWPINWEFTEPLSLEEFEYWLYHPAWWAVDPADLEGPPVDGNWPTPTQAPSAPNAGSNRKCGPKSLDKAARYGAPIWATPTVSDPNHRQGVGTPSFERQLKRGQLGCQVKIYDSPGPIPRVATGIKERVKRLAALGDGQVPACAAMAFLHLIGAVE